MPLTVELSFVTIGVSACADDPHKCSSAAGLDNQNAGMDTDAYRSRGENV